MVLQVRKAAYQSLGAFISTFYIPNGNISLAENETTIASTNNKDGDESSLGILSNSMLQDDSLLDSPTPSSATTTDSSSDSRHALPTNSLPVDDGAISNASTPIHVPNGNGNGTSGNQSRSAMEKLVQDPEFSNFEFWRSPISNVTKGKEGVANKDGAGSEVIGKEGVTVSGGYYIE